MLFSTPLFVFLFLPVFLGSYFLVRHHFRNIILLAFSVIFYAWGEPRFVIVVLVSSLADYLLGLGIYRSSSHITRKWLVGLGIANNLCILFYFKYANFFLATVSAIAQKLSLGAVPLLEIALPIGVSFIVFEKITYIVDLYRGTGRPARSFSLYLLYVFFFPKLLAGPIVKYHDIEPQLEKRRFTRDDIVIGCSRFSTGLAKKVLIADVLGSRVDPIFQMDPNQLGVGYAWMGMIFFTLQIFFDFSGYSDMAIGLARMLGFRLQENFNAPYISASFTEFWRRWHISLSTWIREYLYIPLGGSRGSTARTYANLWLCFLASGLWHGAKWTFVLWGLYQGLFLVIDRRFWLRISTRLPKIVTVPLCFFAIMLGWVLFRADRVSHAVFYTMALFRLQTSSVPFVYVSNGIYAAALVGLLLSFAPLVRICQRHGEWLEATPAGQTMRLGLALLLLVLTLGKVAGATFVPFLYFRF